MESLESLKINLVSNILKNPVNIIPCSHIATMANPMRILAAAAILVVSVNALPQGGVDQSRVNAKGHPLTGFSVR